MTTDPGVSVVDVAKHLGGARCSVNRGVETGSFDASQGAAR